MSASEPKVCLWWGRTLEPHGEGETPHHIFRASVNNGPLLDLSLEESAQIIHILGQAHSRHIFSKVEFENAKASKAAPGTEAPAAVGSDTQTPSAGQEGLCAG